MVIIVGNRISDPSSNPLYNIQYPHGADECFCWLANTGVSVSESIGEHRLWVRPYFSSSAQHFIILFGWFVRLEVSGHIAAVLWRYPWCNGYCRRKWTRQHEFKSWTRLIAFHIAQIPLGKVWIQLFSLQLWVNSWTDWVLQPWWGN